MNAASPTLRLCFVCGEIFGITAVGGGERQIGLLRHAFAGRGVPCDVVTRAVEELEGAVVPDAEDVYTYVGRPGFRLDWVRAVTEAAARSSADVFYQRGSSVLTIAAARAAARNGAAFVWALSSDADLDSALKRFARARTDRLGSGQARWRAAAGAVIDASTQYRARRRGLKANAVVAQTEAQAAQVRRVSPATKLAVLPSLSPGPTGADTDMPRDLVLWVGADKPVKRPELFLDVARQGPHGFSYVMVGRGLERFAGDVATVDIRRPMPHDALFELYGRAFVLINTSSVEGFPNTFLEAWSRGTPVITLGLDPDGVVSRHGLGWVCPDVDAALSALSEAASSPEALQGVRHRCLTYVAEKFRDDETVDRTLALLSAASRRSGDAT